MSKAIGTEQINYKIRLHKMSCRTLITVDDNRGGQSIQRNDKNYSGNFEHQCIQNIFLEEFHHENKVFGF